MAAAAREIGLTAAAAGQQLQLLENEIGPVSYTHLTLPTILRV